MRIFSIAILAISAVCVSAQVTTITLDGKVLAAFLTALAPLALGPRRACYGAGPQVQIRGTEDNDLALYYVESADRVLPETHAISA